jgi:hypothetical protein
MPSVKTASSGAQTPENLLRQKLIDEACEGWTSRLIDLSRRNNLLFYRPVTNGTLELPVSAPLMEFLSSGAALPICELLGDNQGRLTSVRQIARKGLENLEEKGLSTLYLALGKCTWTADDGGRDPDAPILLIPIALNLKGQDLPATEVQLVREIEVNPVLLHIFNKELNIHIAHETILDLYKCEGDENPSEGPVTQDGTREIVSIQRVLEFLNSKITKLPGFRAEPFAVLGNFSFQKLSMVRDLEIHKSDLMENDVIAAIAGDTPSRRALSALQTPVMGMVQRGGEVRFRVMERLTVDRMAEFIAENADHTCRIITDELGTYKAMKLSEYFEGGHETVTHSAKEYVRKGTDIHSKSIEGVFFHPARNHGDVP